jgi:hypothetical protein
MRYGSRIGEITMAVRPQPRSNGVTTRDSDRAAVLVGYTLLGAAINGFVPEVPGTLDRGVRATAIAALFARCHGN